MTKPEWGNKRTCPKCGARFYDLGKDDPACCIECGTQWVPEPILKTKQPITRDDTVEPEAESKDNDSDDQDSDEIDIPADLDVNLNENEEDDEDDNDDVLVDVSLDDEDSDVNDIIDVSLVQGDE